jgi:hypothetical protein
LTGKLRIYNAEGQMLMYSEQKMFKLKEDIRVYTDESKTQELLYIQARQVLDFAAAYDVSDSSMGQKVGVLRRKGLRSLLRDEWQIAHADDQPFAVLQEDSIPLALLRRLVLGSWLPQNYDILIDGQRVVDVRQRFNPFRYELGLDFSMDPQNRLDRRLGIAAGVLLAIVEGRQES